MCRRLLAEGYEVICLDNLLTGSQDNVEHLQTIQGFHFVHADITEELSVAGSVELVIHLACPASARFYMAYPNETLSVGSLGTHRALGLAHRNGTRFLLASTSEVYGEPMVHPQHESYWGNVNPIGPRSVYDEAKRYAEAITAAYRRSHRANTAIMRIFNTYGPYMRRDDGRAVPTLIDQALSGQPLTITGDGCQTRSLCYIDDLIDGIFRLLRSDYPGPVNIVNPHEITISELAASILELTGSPSRIEYIPRPPDDPARRSPDITLARQCLGWSPSVPLAEGLKRTVAWFRDRSELSPVAGQQRS